jgi:hypothetical protein
MYADDLTLPICTALVVTAVFTLQWCFKGNTDKDTDKDKGTDTDKDNQQNRPPPYEAFYPLDTQELSETPENVAACRVEDETPQGRVAMTYAADEQAFLYWSDRSAVPYRYLDTVARKWVIVFDLRDVYVNIYREALHALNHKKATKDKVNKYCWRGRFADRNNTPPPQKKAAANVIRYSDFKKL